MGEILKHISDFVGTFLLVALTCTSAAANFFRLFKDPRLPLAERNRQIVRIDAD